MRAAAHQHHDVGVLRRTLLALIADLPVADQRGNFVGKLPRLQFACAFFAVGIGFQQRVAQFDLSPRFRACRGGGQISQRQHFDVARQRLLVGIVALESRIRRQALEHAVHDIQHGGRVAPRLVFLQMYRVIMLLQKLAHHAEQPCIGAPETVNGLFGIAHHKYGRLAIHRF